MLIPSNIYLARYEEGVKKIGVVEVEKKDKSKISMEDAENELKKTLEDAEKNRIEGLRDYFAGVALNQIIDKDYKLIKRGSMHDQAAKDAYKYADSMLKVKGGG